MWGVHTRAACKKKSHWQVPICLPLQWGNQLHFLKLLLLLISFHLFCSFCCFFLEKVCKESIVQGFLMTVPSQRGEISSQFRGGEKKRDVGFFHETRLISLIRVSTTFVKPAASFATTPISLGATSRLWVVVHKSNQQLCRSNMCFPMPSKKMKEKKLFFSKWIWQEDEKFDIL